MLHPVFKKSDYVFNTVIELVGGISFMETDISGVGQSAQHTVGSTDVGIRDLLGSTSVNVELLIDACLINLRQLGVVPLVVSVGGKTWEEVFGDSLDKITAIPAYVCYWVLYRIDTPETNVLNNALKSILDELETRVEWEADEYRT